MARSDFLAALEARGFVHQMTDREGLDTALTGEPLPAYVGYDATAGSLHVGNLVSIMMLRWLQRTGHKPIILVGGGTTKVGDPSGKDEARQLLDDDRIAANIAGIRSCFERFVQFGDGPTDAVLVDNADWLDRLVYIPFLRDIGRHFTINRMLTFDSVRTRLEREQPLTLLEFNYMILQAYDFRELSRRYGCRLQMGGSDQWGNIVNGIELARRLDGRELFGLTCGLITTASGQKMGKTHQGAVWLNAEALADWDYWQFWRNTEDADVGRFLKLFTDLPLDEIARLEALGGAEINEAKKILATEATRLARGDAAAAAAQETARQTFELGASADGLPTLDLARSRLADGVAAYRLFQEAGLAASNGEARRLIRGQGGRLNDATLDQEDRPITLADLNADGVVKLSAGRKRHVLVRAV